MRLFLLLAFLLPLCLAGQCYGSFEVFTGGGISGTSQELTSEAFSSGPVPVFRFGFGASFLVGRRLLLRTGLQFNQYGETTTLNTRALLWGSQHDGDGGFTGDITSGEDFGEIKTDIRHLYAEGMLALRYEFETYSPWRPFVEGGFIIGKYGSTISRDKSGTVATMTRKEDSFRSLAPIGRFGAGVNYNFNRHVGVYGQPVLQYHLASVNDSAATRLQPWQLTLELGVRVFMDPR